MANILVIFLCLTLGVLLRYLKKMPDQAHITLNGFVINVAIPALALYYIPQIKISRDLIFPIATAWIIFAASWIFFGLLGHFKGWSRKLTGCLILTAGLGNTAFVGFPMVKALYGTEGLKTAIILDQPGTFLIVSTLGLVVAALYSGAVTNTSMLLKKVLYFPPFLGFLAGILLNAFSIAIHETGREVLLMLSGTITPLAMVSVGLQLRIQRRSSHWGFLALGLAFKLIIAPLLIFVLYGLIFNLKGDLLNVCVVEAGMAPMVTAAIVASAYGLKPKFSTLMLSVGIPVSLATVLLWSLLLKLPTKAIASPAKNELNIPFKEP